MATVVLFHSALGLRPSVQRMAAQLETAGHRVVAPDLFEGRVFEGTADGAAHRDAVGIGTLSARAEAAVDALPDDVVYAGLSMGAASATYLALTRPGARGVVLLHGVIPPQMMGVDRWPSDLPVLVHRSAQDPWVEPAHVALFHEAVPDDVLTEHVHPGAAHLFTDEDLAEHDAAASDEVVASVLSFLGGLDGA